MDTAQANFNRDLDSVMGELDGLRKRVNNLGESSERYRAFWINESRRATLLEQGDALASFSQARWDASSPPHPTVMYDSVTESETEPESESERESAPGGISG